MTHTETEWKETTLTIVTAKVIESHYGQDLIVIGFKESFVSPVYPFNEPLEMEFKAAKGTGQDYIRKNFNIEPEVICV